MVLCKSDISLVKSGIFMPPTTENSENNILPLRNGTTLQARKGQKSPPPPNDPSALSRDCCTGLGGLWGRAQLKERTASVVWGPSDKGLDMK